MNFQGKNQSFIKAYLISFLIATMVSLGLSIQVMAAPVPVQIVDINDSDIIEVKDGVAEIYIRLDNVEEYYEDLSGYNPPFVLDPDDPDYDPDDPEALEKLKNQIQSIQFVFMYPSSILEIIDVEAFGVTAGSGSYEAWPVRSNIVVDGELYVNLSMNPVDPNDPDWSKNLYEVEANPDLDWNLDEIYSLPESGKVLKISANVDENASGDYLLTLEEIQQDVPEESLVSLAILNEKDKETGEDIIPSEIVPGTLRVDGCPIPWTYHAYPLATCKFYGSAKISGVDVQVGDVIGAFVSDVEVNDGCIGYFEVTEKTVSVRGEGEYGLLAAYGDDPTTQEKDGAHEGDVVTFKILDRSDCEIYCTEPQEDSLDEPIWNKDTTKNVNLDTVPCSFELYLSENWNLISWNVAACFYQDSPGPPTDPLPSGTELINISDLGFDYMADWITDLLKPCNPDFTEIPWRIVQGAHPGGEVTVMDSNVPSRFHTLKYMSAGYSYAIKLKEGTGGGTIRLEGFPRLKPDAVLPLAQNWNMVGYLPGIGYYDTVPLPDPSPCNPDNLVYATPDCWIQKDPPVVDYVFESIAGKWRIIQGARPGGEVTVADSAVPPRFWTLHHTCPGDGYYIKLNNDADLTYPADSCPDAAISMSPIAQIVPSRNTSVKPTNLAMFIYGAVSLDGKPAPLGSRITVWTSSGVLIGEGTVDETGEYGFLPIYGDDFTTPELDGAHVGDGLVVKVDGHSVSQQSVRWLGDHAVQKVDLEVYTRIIPSASWLGQNYPNPFNPETWLPYALSESAEVTIQIYDIRGSLVRTLNIGRKPAGVYDTKELAGYWDGRNDAGERISSGLYFYKLIAGTFTQVKRMTIIK
jgi:hypothetical protein